MKLDHDEALRRLNTADHGVLCTVHAERGVDAVPVVYALVGRHVGIPIDRVKDKTTGRLGRERNLDADPRATLLVEHWDRDDWSTLWWVRAELRRHDVDTAVADEIGARLAERFPQYADRPFDRIITLSLVGLSGWSARPEA